VHKAVPEDSEFPVRRSPRIKGFDYSCHKIYFVTICTQNKRSIFGKISDGTMLPKRQGKIVQEAWYELPDYYPRLELDSFGLMPNHVHGILALIDPVGAGLRPARAADRHGLPEIIRAFKSFSAKRIAEIYPSLRGAIWQRSFNDHIIRNGDDFEKARRYIFQNPAKWESDRENLSRNKKPT
jgi:putative transposase